MEQKQTQDKQEHIDISRSENQQKQNAGGRGEGTQADNRPEGAENKGTGLDPERSTKEGEYDKQSDNPTMHPSGADGK